jgi:hypothetical protein
MNSARKARNPCFFLTAFPTQKPSGTHEQYITFFLTKWLQTAFELKCNRNRNRVAKRALSAKNFTVPMFEFETMGCKISLRGWTVPAYMMFTPSSWSVDRI